MSQSLMDYTFRRLALYYLDFDADGTDDGPALPVRSGWHETPSNWDEIR